MSHGGSICIHTSAGEGLSECVGGGVETSGGSVCVCATSPLRREREGGRASGMVVM